MPSTDSVESLEKVILSGEYWLLDDCLLTFSNRTLSHQLNKTMIKCLAIQQAVEDGDLIAVKQLMDDQKYALCRDPFGRTSLHTAVILGRKKIVQHILLLYPKCVHCLDQDDRDAMYYAQAITDINLRNEMIAMLTNAIQITEIDSANRQAEKIISYNSTNAIQNEQCANADLERRLLRLDFEANEFAELEQIQVKGQLRQLRQILARNVDNEPLMKFVKRFHKQQDRLNMAILAIESNHLEKFKNLIDPNLVRAKNNKGLTLLHIAVCKERQEIVEFLISEFPEIIDILDTNGRLPIHYAAGQKNKIYDILLQKGANDLRADKDGWTAAQYRDNSVGKSLLPPSPMISLHANFTFDKLTSDEGMFDPDAPNESDLKRWLINGDVERLEEILLDGRGYMLANKTSDNEATNEFLQGLTTYQMKIDAIHKAVEEGDLRRFKSLVDRERLATARDRYGMTPLHIALLHGQTSIVRYLLSKYPLCVNAADHVGRTALHYAYAQPIGEHVVKLLQKYGADPFVEDKFEHEPFYYQTHSYRLNVKIMKDSAIMNDLITGQINQPLLQDLEEDICDWIHTNNIGKVEELVLNGYVDLLLGRTHDVADSEISNFLEVLPQYQAKIKAAHRAIETGNFNAARLLIDRKKMAFCRDDRHLTPLHKAVVFSETRIAKFLIRNYPLSINAIDQNKRTPLHYAAVLRDGGYLYKLMLKSGGDPNAYDCYGRPPKYYLRHSGEIEIQAMRMGKKAILDQVLHSRVAPSYLETSIRQWLRERNVKKLEQLVLSGCGDLLLNCTATNPDSAAYLEQISSFLKQIDEVHQLIREANLDALKQKLACKKLTIARNQHGCTPLHTAIVYEQTEIIRYFAVNFPNVLNAPDYNRRTPLHYAAATHDGGHYMKILSKAGADPFAMDNEGRTPDYYRRNPIMNLQLIKENDDEYNIINDQLMYDAIVHGSPRSAELLSMTSSSTQSLQLDDPNEHEPGREHMVVDKPITQNGLYLEKNVAPLLTSALVEVLINRPPDPIDFLSNWLTQHHQKDGTAD